MHEPLYRQALDKSWHLLWEHKKIWIFGLFATFLGQLGLADLFAKVSLVASNAPVVSWWLTLPKVLLVGTPVAGGLVLSLESVIWLISLILLLLGLGLLGIFLAVVSHGALIRISADYAKHKNLPSLSRAWQSGVEYFWPLFFLQVIKKIVLCLLACAVGYATLNVLLGLSVWSLILFLLVFILAAVVGMVVSFLTVYAAGYLVVENYPWRRAVAGAWKLFLGHWLVSVEVGLVVLILNLVAALIALASFLVFFLPTLISWLIAVLTLNSALWWAGLIVGIFFSVLFMMFLGTLLTIYTTAVWTYLFMKMHREGVVSRVLHWLK